MPLANARCGDRMTDAARSSSRMSWLPLGPLGARRRSSDQESTGGGLPARPRGRLFRKYVLLIVGLVSLVLLLNSALDFWFGYEENKAALFRIQQEKAAVCGTPHRAVRRRDRAPARLDHGAAMGR